MFNNENGGRWNLRRRSERQLLRTVLILLMEVSEIVFTFWVGQSQAPNLWYLMGAASTTFGQKLSVRRRVFVFLFKFRNYS